jgi:radical SAM protein with 4Fe4S-binding SPASM domain
MRLWVEVRSHHTSKKAVRRSAAELSISAAVRLRAEWFGAIVELKWPRVLVQVNRAFARRLGLVSSERWSPTDPGHLSAPTEVHVVLSKRCSVGCTGCYVDATPAGAVMSLERARAALKTLANHGVFHVALGGGEAMDLEYLFEVAAYARSVGILPNLTTSGIGLTDEQARRCTVFGQINVSLDGVADVYRQARGIDAADLAIDAARRLRSWKKEVGINCVVSRSTYPHLDDVVKCARALKLNEVELLRYKPAGRGIAGFAKEDLLPEQAEGIYPLVKKLMFRHRMRIKLDCSFAPMIFWHRPSMAAARFFGVVGCDAGNQLASVMPDGSLTGCSFGGPREADIADEPAVARALRDGFGAFRGYAAQAAEPCRSCEYLPLCNGGCRVVAKAAGDWWKPDPGCPRVRRHGAV